MIGVLLRVRRCLPQHHGRASWWNGQGPGKSPCTPRTPASGSARSSGRTRGLRAWDLIVVDEAHRTSGRIGKPWAVVHDNQKIPSLRRLYMTATPRLWQLADDEDQGQGGAPGELVASMDDDPEGPFGSAFTLTLSQAIDRGICAPYQVVCVDVTDTQLQAQLLGGRAFGRGPRGAARRSADRAGESVRRGRIPAHAGLHHVVKEAEAFAAGYRMSPRGCTMPIRSCTRRRSGPTGCAGAQGAPPQARSGSSPPRSRRTALSSRRRTGVREGARGRRRYEELRLRVLR
nr:DEAD/DEAH box helicase family protein [Streptomyces agglomeratus]